MLTKKSLHQKNQWQNKPKQVKFVSQHFLFLKLLFFAATNEFKVKKFSYHKNS